MTKEDRQERERGLSSLLLFSPRAGFLAAPPPHNLSAWNGLRRGSFNSLAPDMPLVIASPPPKLCPRG